MASKLPSVRRTAGQSIRDEKERLLDNRLLPFYFTCVFAWILWGWEAFKAQTNQPPQPKLLLCFAIVVTGVAAIIVGRLFRRFRNLNRGERGEMKVAELLEELRSWGYQPFHDLARDGYNIDHVVVGPAGVFVIETKFRSGRGTINFRNGEGLLVNGAPDKSERDPVAQARGNAAEVRKMIKEDCKLDVWSTAVVVFVGDWKVKETWKTTDARVVSQSQLLRYFEQQDQPLLTRSELKLIASHLERSVKG